MFFVVLISMGLVSVQAAVETNPCDIDYPSVWPPDVPDDLLIYKFNEQENKTEPKFQIFSTNDTIRQVQPDTEYNFSLKQLDPQAKLSRFLIVIDTFELDSTNDEDKCHDTGALKSLSDESQHLSYDCLKYLVERSELDVIDIREILFSWHTPQCGCFQISAEVLDSVGQIYTRDNDPLGGLLIQTCVGRTNMSEQLDKFDQIENFEQSAHNHGAEVEPELTSTDLDNEEPSEVEEIVSKISADFSQGEESKTLRDEDKDVVKSVDAEDVVKQLLDAAQQLEEKEDFKLEQQQSHKSLNGTKSDVKKDRRRRRKLRRQRRRNSCKRRRGQKYCCRKGIRTKKVEDSDICTNPPEHVLSKANLRYKLRAESCSRTFEKCCQDKRFGKKMIRILGKLEKYKYLARKLRKQQKQRKPEEKEIDKDETA